LESLVKIEKGFRRGGIKNRMKETYIVQARLWCL